MSSLDAVIAEMDAGDPRYCIGVQPATSAARLSRSRRSFHRATADEIAGMLSAASLAGRRRSDALAELRRRHNGRDPHELSRDEVRSEWARWRDQADELGPA